MSVDKYSIFVYNSIHIMQTEEIMDNYEVLGVIHSSNTSGTIILKVKEKNSSNNDKIYALKLVGSLDNRLHRLIFKREVEALRKLNACENIVKIRDHMMNVEFNNRKNWGAILLDYVAGDNLENINLDSASQMKRYEICMKILRAVEDAHNYSVLHRDIKPSNIMYDIDTDEVTLIDFGTSKIKSSIEEETTLPFYSPNYSAPEIVKGNSSTESSDIYSLGAVMFKIIFGIVPDGSAMIKKRMEDMQIMESLSSLISKMTEENPEDRFQEIGQVMDAFEKIIGENMPIKENYICTIDVDKLQKLKKNMLVEANTTMAIFTNSFLKNQFCICSAFIDSRNQNYVFTGKKVAIECSYDTSNEVFRVVNIYGISIDRKISNEKRGFRINGQINFVDNAKKERLSRGGYNDNEKLIVALNNNAADKQDIQRQTQLFDDLFGRWQDGIEESIDNEKRKSGCIKYTKFIFTDSQLLLTIEEYKNGNIDELTNEMQYLVEEKDYKGNSFYYDIGNFNNVSYEGDETVLTIDLCNGFQAGKVKPLIRKNKSIVENFRAKISAYKRQYYAIRALYDDNYSARNLKDILLNLEKPTSTPSLNQIEYSSNEFNTSQKEAIRKALYSDSISLIQGPPGTGKTKVIKEIIRQIINRINKVDDTSRILVVSQSHTAVDNIVEGLIDIENADLDIIRIGREENISKPVFEKCTMESIRKSMFMNIEKRSRAYMEEKDAIYQNVEDIKEKEHWGRIKDIQEDWINRCSNLETLDYQVIKSATIIAGTCVGFLSNDFVKELDFDYVIIDEAAKATTPEMLVSIIKAKKIVLVGDQNQLPAYADKELSPMIAKLTKEPKYRLFDILFDVLPDSHKQILTIQYRMRRSIGDLISQVFYNNLITTGVDDSKRIHNISMFKGKSVVWIDTSNMQGKDETDKKGGSYCNHAENTIIKKLLTRLKKDGELSSVNMGIITGYRGQKDLILKTVANNGFDKIAKEIDINTLDAFQGRENNIIIYSTVRTKKSIGFQKEKERVNVAFSRAKDLLIICGDMNFFYQFDDADNKFIEIIDYITEHNDECKIVPGGSL